MVTLAKNATVRIKYHGPKPNKHLDLPVGIISKSDIECSVVFAAASGGCANVPAQYVAALLEISEVFDYADDAARHAYASWLTDSSPVATTLSAPRVAPSVIEPQKPVFAATVTTPSYKKDVPLILETFEELL